MPLRAWQCHSLPLFPFLPLLGFAHDQVRVGARSFFIASGVLILPACSNVVAPPDPMYNLIAFALVSLPFSLLFLFACQDVGKADERHKKRIPFMLIVPRGHEQARSRWDYRARCCRYCIPHVPWALGDSSFVTPLLIFYGTLSRKKLGQKQNLPFPSLSVL